MDLSKTLFSSSEPLSETTFQNVVLKSTLLAPPKGSKTSLAQEGDAFPFAEILEDGGVRLFLDQEGRWFELAPQGYDKPKIALMPEHGNQDPSWRPSIALPFLDSCARAWRTDDWVYAEEPKFKETLCELIREGETMHDLLLDRDTQTLYVRPSGDLPHAVALSRKGAMKLSNKLGRSEPPKKRQRLEDPDFEDVEAA